MKEYTSYQEFGEGETIVLLPSNWLTSKSYQSLAQKLAKKYRVIVPDLYRGRSTYEKNARSVDDYTHQLHHLLQNLKIRNFYLLGFSFSTLVALEYLNQYPSDVKKVLLVSPIIPSLYSKGSKFTFINGFTGYIKLFYHYAFSKKGIKVNLLWLYDGIFNYFIRHPKQFLLDPLIATRKRKDVESKIPVPTKILLARRDEFIPYKDLNVEKIHNLEAEIVEGYHAWFFLNEDLLVEKIFNYFIP